MKSKTIQARFQPSTILKKTNFTSVLLNNNMSPISTKVVNMEKFPKAQKTS